MIGGTLILVKNLKFSSQNFRSPKVQFWNLELSHFAAFFIELRQFLILFDTNIRLSWFSSIAIGNKVNFQDGDKYSFDPLNALSTLTHEGVNFIVEIASTNV